MPRKGTEKPRPIEPVFYSDQNVEDVDGLQGLCDDSLQEFQSFGRDVLVEGTQNWLPFFNAQVLIGGKSCIGLPNPGIEPGTQVGDKCLSIRRQSYLLA